MNWVSAFLIVSAGFSFGEGAVYAEDEGRLSAPSYAYNRNLSTKVVMLKIAAPRNSKISFQYLNHTLISRKPQKGPEFIGHYIDIPEDHKGPLPVNVLAEIPNPQGKGIIRASSGILNVPPSHQVTLSLRLSDNENPVARVVYWTNTIVNTYVNYDRPRTIFYEKAKNPEYAYLAIWGEQGIKISIKDRRNDSLEWDQYPLKGPYDARLFPYHKFPESSDTDEIALTAKLKRDNRVHTVEIPFFRVYKRHMTDIVILWDEGELKTVFIDPRREKNPATPLVPINDDDLVAQKSNEEDEKR